MSSRKFSPSQAARLFTRACDVLIPVGLLVVFAEQLRLIEVERRSFEAIGRSVLLLVLALTLLHIALLFTARRRGVLGPARAFVYLLLLMTISIIRIP